MVFSEMMINQANQSVFAYILGGFAQGLPQLHHLSHAISTCLARFGR